MTNSAYDEIIYNALVEYEENHYMNEDADWQDAINTLIKRYNPNDSNYQIDKFDTMRKHYYEYQHCLDCEDVEAYLCGEQGIKLTSKDIDCIAAIYREIQGWDESWTDDMWAALQEYKKED